MLREIYFPNDYTNELLTFQKENKLIEGHTQNDVAIGFAITLPIITEDNEKNIVIFYRPEILIGIIGVLMVDGNAFDEAKDEFFMVLNTLYHEFCHVNDHYHQKSMLDFSETNQMDILNKMVFSTSLSTWEEYYAYRMTSRRYPLPNLDKEHLMESLEWLSKRTIELKEKFITDKDMDYFWVNFYNDSFYVLRTAAGLYGTTIELPFDECEKTMEEINIMLQDTYFAQTFSELGEQLTILYDNYPNWNGFNSLLPINKVVINFWNSCNVYPEDIGGNRLWVGI